MPILFRHAYITRNPKPEKPKLQPSLQPRRNSLGDRLKHAQREGSISRGDDVAAGVEGSTLVDLFEQRFRDIDENANGIITVDEFIHSFSVSGSADDLDDDDDDVDVDDNHVPLQAPPTGVSAGNGRAEEDVDVDGDGDGGRTSRKESEHAVTFQVA